MHIDFTKISKNRFLIGVIINSLFVIVELYYGFKSNSLALLADAVHNLSDVIGLGVVWFAYVLARQEATHKFTYGFKGATIVATFVNSLILFIAVGNLMWESVVRLVTPQVVAPMTMVVVAGAGIIVNGVTALLFSAGKDKDIGIQSIYLSFTLDVLLSLAVLFGGLFIISEGWTFIDPMLGFIIGVTIFVSLWKLFKESFTLFFQGVPKNIMLKNIIDDINATPQIISYHDLHIWALSTTETALSMHIVTDKDNYSPEIIENLTELFKNKYEIEHITIQMETVGESEECSAC